MPAATTTTADKTEREQRLLEALKTHILKERQRKKEEHEAEVEEERQRKEREARERQDVMTLGETREKILKLNQSLKELKNHKQQLFLQLKKVLNEDENRKKQKKKKESEMFAMHQLPPQTSAPIFLPPRQTHQTLIQKGPVGMGNPPLKRGRSPSPPPPQSYYKSAAYSSSPKHEDTRRGGEVARVLWNKPTQYQTPPGTLFYQTTSAPPSQPDSRTQSIIYPPYNPNINMPLRQNYHIELPQPPPQQQGHTPQKAEQPPKSAQVYHINLDQPPPISQAGQNQSAPPGQHKPQVTMEKIPDRGAYHVEVQLDPSQPPTHLPEGVVYTPLMSGIPIHPMQMPQNQNQSAKSGGSITQGYPPNRSNQPPPMPGQQHYPRRLF